MKQVLKAVVCGKNRQKGRGFSITLKQKLGMTSSNLLECGVQSHLGRSRIGGSLARLITEAVARCLC